MPVTLVAWLTMFFLTIIYFIPVLIPIITALASMIIILFFMLVCGWVVYRVVVVLTGWGCRFLAWVWSRTFGWWRREVKEKDMGKAGTGKGKEMRQLRLEGKSPKRVTFQEDGLPKGGCAEEKARIADSAAL